MTEFAGGAPAAPAAAPAAQVILLMTLSAVLDLYVCGILMPRCTTQAWRGHCLPTEQMCRARHILQYACAWGCDHASSGNLSRHCHHFHAEHSLSCTQACQQRRLFPYWHNTVPASAHHVLPTTHVKSTPTHRHLGPRFTDPASILPSPSKACKRTAHDMKATNSLNSHT